VCVREAYAASTLKASVSVFGMCGHVVYPEVVISQDDVCLWIKFWDLQCTEHGSDPVLLQKLAGFTNDFQ